MFEMENCMLRENKSDLCTLNFILIFVMKNLPKVRWFGVRHSSGSEQP